MDKPIMGSYKVGVHNFTKDDGSHPTEGELKNVEELVKNDYEKPYRRFKSQWNGEQSPKRYEKVSALSQTIPDQTMSVSEIMNRYAKGLPLTGERVPIYHGDEEFVPDIKTLDLSEIEDLKIQAQNSIDENRRKLAQLDAERKKIKENLKINKQPLKENDSTSFDPDKDKKQKSSEDEKH